MGAEAVEGFRLQGVRQAKHWFEVIKETKFFLEKDRTVREAVASMDADTTDRVIWSRFYAGGIHELPLSFNAHRGLRLDDDEWRQVHLVHASSRWELDKRSPSWLDELVPSFTAA